MQFLKRVLANRGFTLMLPRDDSMTLLVVRIVEIILTARDARQSDVPPPHLVSLDFPPTMEIRSMCAYAARKYPESFTVIENSSGDVYFFIGGTTAETSLD